MNQLFDHDFYFILGIDEYNGFRYRLIKVGEADVFEERLADYKHEYPTFQPMIESHLTCKCSAKSKVLDIQDDMKFICKNHKLKVYDINHNGKIGETEWFLLNTTRKSNIKVIAELMRYMYGGNEQIAYERAEKLFTEAFGD